MGTALISLWRLSRDLDGQPHVDLLHRLCLASGIAVHWRFNTRMIGPADADSLKDALQMWRDRPRIWSARP